MVDGVSESVVVLLGACVPKREQGEDIRRARILTDLSDHRICICCLVQCFHYTKGKCWFKGGETKRGFNYEN
jgi:hypothetical protein